MSSKSTILSLPCCHIYHDCIGANGGDTLVISVSYQNVEEGSDYNDHIEVEHDSEFARLIRHLLKGADKDELRRVSKGEI